MNTGGNTNPLLRRDLDLTPVKGDDGGTMILLRDPFSLDQRGPLAFSEGALPLLSLLDGKNSADDIRSLLLGQLSGEAGVDLDRDARCAGKAQRVICEDEPGLGGGDVTPGNEHGRMAGAERKHDRQMEPDRVGAHCDHAVIGRPAEPG